MADRRSGKRSSPSPDPDAVLQATAQRRDPGGGGGAPQCILPDLQRLQTAYQAELKQAEDAIDAFQA